MKSPAQAKNPQPAFYNVEGLNGRKRMKIVICDPLDREGMEIFRGVGKFDLVEAVGKTPAELKKILKDAAAVVVRSGTKLTADLIQSAKSLRIIGRAGVGLDNVDLEAASKRGIVVVNTPAGNTISAAEHTLALMMALSRNVPAAHASMREGRWDRKKFTGVELFDKTLGLVGLGRIGTEVAKRAQSFGMRVVAYDPFLRVEQALKLGVTLTELDSVFKQSDFISLHLPLTAETRNLISEKSLSKMKKGVRIINCARGGLIKESDLLAALKNGKVAGAALDVFEKEPPGKSELLEHPLVIATPHLGASTEEAQIKVSIDIARTMVDFLTGKALRNAVNMPCVDPEVLKEIEPYIVLAEKIGLMHAQLAQGHVQQVHIRYNGTVVEMPTNPMTIAVIKGLLTPIMAENVNYVNALVLAKERGIRITESTSSEPSTFANLIHVTVKTDKEKRSIAGTLYTRADARIVVLDDLRVELEAKGYVLCIWNKDVPGMVGHIGTVLGKNKVNIADMTVGRDKPGGRARTLISIDHAISEQVMNKIRASKSILDAKLIRL